MRSLPLSGLGIFFLVAAVGLLALSFRKPVARKATPTKAELRAESALQKETRKMRIAAAVTALIGMGLIAIS